jgi:hypothetical protein
MKHSPRDITPASVLLLRVPNLNGGNWDSRPLEVKETLLVEQPFARTRDGRLKEDFFRSCDTVCLGFSMGNGGRDDGEESSVVRPRGSRLNEESLSGIMMAKGALCGKGEASMASGPAPGDDEGIGGVVVPSTCTVSATSIDCQCGRG